jgi:hypothetical protein
MKERTYHKHRRSVRVDRGSVPARLGWGYAVGRRVRAAWGGLVVGAVAAPRATGAGLVLAARAAGAGAVAMVATAYRHPGLTRVRVGCVAAGVEEQLSARRVLLFPVAPIGHVGVHCVDRSTVGQAERGRRRRAVGYRPEEAVRAVLAIPDGPLGHRTVGAVLSGLAVPARAVRPAVEILAASARAAAPRARTAADAIVVSRRAFRAVRPGARRTSQRQVRGCGSPAGPYTSDTGSDTGTVGLTGRSD